MSGVPFSQRAVEHHRIAELSCPLTPPFNEPASLYEARMFCYATNCCGDQGKFHKPWQDTTNQKWSRKKRNRMSANFTSWREVVCMAASRGGLDCCTPSALCSHIGAWSDDELKAHLPSTSSASTSPTSRFHRFYFHHMELVDFHSRPAYNSRLLFSMKLYYATVYITTGKLYYTFTEAVCARRCSICVRSVSLEVTMENTANPHLRHKNAPAFGILSVVLWHSANKSFASEYIAISSQFFKTHTIADGHRMQNTKKNGNFFLGNHHHFH